MTIRVILIVVAALVVADIASQAQPLPHSLYLRGCTGIAAQSLKDWNDEIKADEQVLTSQGVPASYDQFGAGFPLGVEGGFNLSDVVSLGVAVTYQMATVNNEVSVSTASLTSDATVSLTGLMANASFWVPQARGLFFGANLGIGFGTVKSESHFRDTSDPASNLDATANWDGNAPIYGAFAGYGKFFSKGQLIFMKLGYQFQNLGKLDGTGTSPQLGNWSGPPVNNAGKQMDTDFSGLQLLVGFGVAFGGATPSGGGSGL